MEVITTFMEQLDICSEKAYQAVRNLCRRYDVITPSRGRLMQFWEVAKQAYLLGFDFPG